MRFLPNVNEENKAEIFIDDQIDFSKSDINPENKLARKLTFKDLNELIESPSSEGKTLETASRKGVMTTASIWERLRRLL